MEWFKTVSVVSAIYLFATFVLVPLVVSAMKETISTTNLATEIILLQVIQVAILVILVKAFIFPG